MIIESSDSVVHYKGTWFNKAHLILGGYFLVIQFGLMFITGFYMRYMLINTSE